MWISYVLGYTNEQLSQLTPKEFVNLWHAYAWRKQQQETMLASLVTVWIANTAGKSLKKNLKVEDIFRDGRFVRPLSEEDRAIIDELYGR